MSLRRTSLLTIVGVAQLLAILGCTDTKYSLFRDLSTEEIIKKFYASNLERLEIKSIMNNAPIDAYCVLTSYQSDLADEEDRVVPVNAFLKQINLLGEEDYWHIVVKSSDRYVLVRINARSIPLAPEYSFAKDSCARENSLVLKKITIPSTRTQTLKIGN